MSLQILKRKAEVGDLNEMCPVLGYHIADLEPGKMRCTEKIKRYRGGALLIVRFETGKNY